MKQALNSLLTLYQIPFNAAGDTRMLPREKPGLPFRNLTPFNVHRENLSCAFSTLPGVSIPPRSIVRSRLGEGRIQSLLQKTALFFFAAFVSVLTVRTCIGSENLVVKLKKETAIQSATIFLKDVADIQSADRDQIERLNRIPLARAPEFGSVTILNRHQIAELIRKSAFNITEDAIEGAAAVQVRLKGRPIDQREIASLLLAHMRETTPWKESEIEILSIENLQRIEIPPGEVKLRLSSKSAIKGHKNILIPVEVVQAGETLQCFWASAKIRVRAVILTAAKEISRGSVIGNGDIMAKVTEIPDLDTSYIRNSEEVLGNIARHSLSPGDPLTREVVAKPFLVKKGETVQLRLEGNGILLTSAARAEQNGKLGQIIRVRNLDFSTTLKAQVSGRAEVELQY
jgi:flagella basal body P-ring formation protein FlgA